MKKKVSIGINSIIVILELIGLVMSLNISGLGILQYFTELSNIFAMITSLLLVGCFIKKKENKIINLLNYISTCCLMTTFLVVLFVLGPMMGYREMFFGSYMILHHLICPILAIINFIFCSGKLIKNSVLFSIIPVLVYGIITLILNIIRLMYGPYPFLHVYEQPIYMTFIWFISIIGGSFICNYCILKFRRK